MPKRPLVGLSFGGHDSVILDQLRKEARTKGLKLASYLKSLILTHQDRRPVRVQRAG